MADKIEEQVIIPEVLEVKNVEEVEETKTEEEIVEEYEKGLTKKTYKQIIAELSPKCKRVNGVKIKNTTLTEEANYTRVTFTLESYIRCYQTNTETGEVGIGFTKFLYTSTFALAAIIKEDENLSYLGNIIADAKDNLGIIFNGATLNILQETVKANEDYLNPFSSNPVPQNFTNDLIINYIVGIKLSATGQRMADKIADKMADKLLDGLI